MTGAGIQLDTAGPHHTLTSEEKKLSRNTKNNTLLNEIHRVLADGASAGCYETNLIGSLGESF